MTDRCRECGEPGDWLPLPQGDFCPDCLAVVVAERDELIGARVKVSIAANVRGASGEVLTWDSLSKVVESITVTANGETQTWPTEELNPSPGKGPTHEGNKSQF